MVLAFGCIPGKTIQEVCETHPSGSNRPQTDFLTDFILHQNQWGELMFVPGCPPVASYILEKIKEGRK